MKELGIRAKKAATQGNILSEDVKNKCLELLKENLLKKYT